MTTLAAEFPQLFASHWPAGKRYFVGHSGISSSSASSNRLEEHTALALMNLGRRWPQTHGGWFRLLDYQLPLKSRQADAGIGKVDLLRMETGDMMPIT